MSVKHDYQFSPIISMKTCNGATELSASISMKTNESGENFRLGARGESPNKMSMII
jgi:hypothetical protein